MAGALLLQKVGTAAIMEDHSPQSQAASIPAWVTGLTYVTALLAGAALIVTGHATPAEASGYVAPFLVIYERMLQRRHIR